MDPPAENFAFLIFAHTQHGTTPKLLLSQGRTRVCARSHTCKEIYSAIVDEELICRREHFNTADPFAVAVVKDSTAVGHAPRKISSVCSLFLV